MKEIRRGMQKVKAGELEGEIKIYRHDELGEVSEEFNEMQRQLKKSREEQKKYEAYRKGLISSVSHDLRTPLTTIKGYVGGILDGIADTEEKRKKYLRAVQTRTADLAVLPIWKIWWISCPIIIKWKTMYFDTKCKSVI